MLKWPLIWFVKLWRRVISPGYGDVCKFHPSCSTYGLCALEVHGGIRGSWLILRRLARCHPWSEGGVDYVPGTPEARLWAAQETSTSPSGTTRPEYSATEVAP
ncbi:membrane protein insertion efficiency factor YidD [Tessaracoccus antarcticus]|uniref:Putative membrane protein insertion efficiency factor n=1 Tax=Tessaracoccus antarcticus TaxID=2479848 RepID=A0A3M0GFM9_9ACTN|nr:membrane protein insertion efficiency factor YidD [Tessaracoccus antarcticus]